MKALKALKDKVIAAVYQDPEKLQIAVDLVLSVIDMIMNS